MDYFLNVKKYIKGLPNVPINSVEIMEGTIDIIAYKTDNFNSSLSSDFQIFNLIKDQNNPSNIHIGII